MKWKRCTSKLNKRKSNANGLFMTHISNMVRLVFIACLVVFSGCKPSSDATPQLQKFKLLETTIAQVHAAFRNGNLGKKLP